MVIEILIIMIIIERKGNGDFITVLEKCYIDFDLW